MRLWKSTCINETADPKPLPLVVIVRI